MITGYWKGNVTEVFHLTNSGFCPRRFPAASNIFSQHTTEDA